MDNIFSRDPKYIDYSDLWDELSYEIRGMKFGEAGSETKINSLAEKVQEKLRQAKTLPEIKKPKLKITPEIKASREEINGLSKEVAPIIQGLQTSIDLYQAHFPELKNDKMLKNMSWKLDFIRSVYSIMFAHALRNLKRDLEKMQKELTEHLKSFKLHL